MAVSTFNFLVSDAVSGNGGSGGDGRKDTNSKETNNILKEGNIFSKRSLQQNLGLQFSVAAILKQSQIFTGFIGSLFQILGAFVDVALMSVFPLLKSSLKVLMKFFDPIKQISSGVGVVVGWLMKIFSWMGSAWTGTQDWLQNNIPGMGDSEASTTTAVTGGWVGAMAQKAKTLSKGVGKKIPIIGGAIAGGSALFRAGESWEQGDMWGGVAAIIEETVNFGLASIFGATGAAIAGGGTFGVGAGAGAVGGVALYELLVKDVVNNVLQDMLGTAGNKKSEATMYAAKSIGGD